MRTISAISTLLTIFALLTGLSSCCKNQTSATLEIEFESFDFSAMDRVLLIETNRDDMNQHLDTTFHDLTANHSIRIPVFDNRADNGNFIIKHTSPDFEHQVTEINADRSKGFGCSGGMIKFGFKLDGIEYEKKKRHHVTIKQ